MPKIYKGNCVWCGSYYEGRGKYFCSDACSRRAMKDRSRRKEINLLKTRFEAKFRNIEDIIKVVELPDLHWPNAINLEPVWSFIEDYNPDYVVLLGDAMDFESISPWMENKRVIISGQDLRGEYDGFKEHILSNLVGRKKIYISGNHERWIDLAIDNNPNARGYWEIHNNIDTNENDILLLPFNNSELILGHLVLMHGKYILDHHAKKTAYVYAPYNVLYCHTHDVQKYLKITPIGNQPVVAESIGCLCTKNPHYMKNQPNSWINSFGVTEFYGSGYFNHTTVHIINNKFCWNGRRY